MNYRQFLINRHGLTLAGDLDPQVLDYMSLRNRDAANAWQRRKSQTAQALSPGHTARETQRRRSEREA